MRIKLVLLADAALLSALQASLSREPEADIQFTASNADSIIDYIEKHGGAASGLLVLADNEIPVLDSAFVQKVNGYGLPLVVITTTVNAGFALLAQGATDMVVRRDVEADNANYFNRMIVMHMLEALNKIKRTRAQDAGNAAGNATGKINGKIIAIGSSTGGTETALHILKQIPADTPPILLVQHMPPVFTKMYAERVNHLCPTDVWEARDGDRLANGRVLIAPGDFHMTLAQKDGQYYVKCEKGVKVCGQCPSVDVLFKSVASVAKADAVGVILTGMGADGAEGLLQMRRNGAYTIGQDESTSIVYGMPKAAYELGAVCTQLPLEKIAQDIIAHARI